ncbi:MAG: hypothetical protein HY438_01355 [DPANN group archaeon]|nr:hypothetical protein [DPANN group archaeon]
MEMHGYGGIEAHLRGHGSVRAIQTHWGAIVAILEHAHNAEQCRGEADTILDALAAANDACLRGLDCVAMDPKAQVFSNAIDNALRSGAELMIERTADSTGFDWIGLRWSEGRYSAMAVAQTFQDAYSQMEAQLGGKSGPLPQVS